MSPFLLALTLEVLDHICESYGTENWDYSRFGKPDKRLKRILLSTISLLFRRAGLGIVVLDSVFARYESMVRDYGEGLSRLYDMLEDEYSRQMLVEVIAYRILGHRRLKLPMNTPEYWAGRKKARSLISGKDTIPGTFQDKPLNIFTLDSIGYPVRLYGVPASIHSMFILHAYAYDKIAPPIKAETGDYVIDAGSCWGDATLYFAHEVGPKGKVYAFEMVPENLEILEKNLQENQELARRVEVVQHPLWSTSGEILNFSNRGPGSQLGVADTVESKHSVTTVSIDDFVSNQDIPKVDFIKMDIEGAELEALQGACETIKKHQPKLAICLYHKLSDFTTIPAYLSSLGVDYKYYIDHSSIYGEETVLFAVLRHREKLNDRG